MGILEDLWYGNVAPSVKTLTVDSKQHDLAKYITKHEEELMPLLSDEAKNVYKKLLENQEELSSVNECEEFISGFQLGARIMLEVMGVNDNE